MNFYQISLWVTVEQEYAIMDLFRNRRWIYWKAGQGSAPQSHGENFQPPAPPAPAHGIVINEQRGNRPLDEKAAEQPNNAMSSNVQPHNRQQGTDGQGAAQNYNGQPFQTAGKNFDCLYDSLNDSSDVLDTALTMVTEFKNGGQNMQRKANTTSTSSPEDKEGFRTRNKRKSKPKSAYRNETTKEEEEEEEASSNAKEEEEKEKEKDNASDEKVSNGKTGSKIANIYCKECQHTFKYSTSYEKHLKEDRCKHVCDYCGKVFLYSRSIDYKIHMKYHRKQKDFECKVCGKQFIERGTMLKHFKKHKGAKLYSDSEEEAKMKKGRKRKGKGKKKEKQKEIHCEDCEHTFKRRGCYDKHLREDRCRHVCDICGKVFLYLRTKDYIIHMKYHNKQKDHACDICGKAFVERGKKLKHERKHLDPRPILCDQCGDNFPSPAALRIHRKNVHNENIEVPVRSRQRQPQNQPQPHPQPQRQPSPKPYDSKLASPYEPMSHDKPPIFQSHHDKPIFPGHDKPIFPGHDKPIFPGHDKPIFPGHDKHIFPGYDKPIFPAYTNCAFPEQPVRMPDLTHLPVNACAVRPPDSHSHNNWTM